MTCNQPSPREIVVSELPKNLIASCDWEVDVRNVPNNGISQFHSSFNVRSGQGATKLFSWLKDCKPDRTGGVRHLPYDASKAEKHAKFCFDNIERAAQHLNHEKMKADQQQEVRERHQHALEKVWKSRGRVRLLVCFVGMLSFRGIHLVEKCQTRVMRCCFHENR